VAQVVARELGISMDLIKLKASSAITSPNNTTTGGSMGSEMNCFVSFSRIFFSCFFQMLLSVRSLSVSLFIEKEPREQLRM
jgi:hypothetical protein